MKALPDVIATDVMQPFCSIDRQIDCIHNQHGE